MAGFFILINQPKSTRLRLRLDVCSISLPCCQGTTCPLAHHIKKTRLTPNIQSLEEIMAYILFQEANDYARRNTHDKVKVNRVGEGDGDPPKKDQKCRISDKNYPRGICAYKCRHCGQKDHKSDGCWLKFPEKEPGYKRDRSLSANRKKKPGERGHSTCQ